MEVIKAIEIKSNAINCHHWRNTLAQTQNTRRIYRHGSFGQSRLLLINVIDIRRLLNKTDYSVHTSLRGLSMGSGGHKGNGDLV